MNWWGGGVSDAVYKVATFFKAAAKISRADPNAACKVVTMAKVISAAAASTYAIYKAIAIGIVERSAVCKVAAIIKSVGAAAGTCAVYKVAAIIKVAAS